MRDFPSKLLPIALQFPESLRNDAARLSVVNRALRFSETRYRRLFETAQDGILLLKGETGKIDDVNPYLLEILGYSRAEVIGKTPWEIGVFRDAALCENAFGELRRRRYLRQSNVPLEAKGGRPVYVEIVGNVYDCDGIEIIQCSIRDDTKRHLAETALRATVRALQVSSETNAVLVSAATEEVLLTEYCRIMVEVGGYRMAWIGLAGTDPGQPILPLAHFGEGGGYLDRDGLIWAEMDCSNGPCGHAIRTGEVQICENIAADLRMTPWRVRALERGFRSSLAVPFRHPDGMMAILTVYGAENVAWLEPERKLLQEIVGDLAFGINALRTAVAKSRYQTQAEYQAYHDGLTGLPNRQLAEDRFAQLKALADRAGTKTAMLFLDLDNFKTVNDSLGHSVGDKLLKVIADRINQCVRDTDTVSRHGGDEFLILLANVQDNGGVIEVAEKIFKRLEGPIDIGDHALYSTASIGIAVYPDDGGDFETLLRNADTAMYRAKEGGRNIYHFFNEKMNDHAIETLRLQNGLRHALTKTEFVLHYQPQIDMASGALVGVEALIRWNHPLLGMVTPGRFIPVAEDTGLIVQIGQWVIEEACRQAVAWQKDGLPEFVIAVNLSALQFRRGNLEQTIGGALSRSGLAPRFLELELTESILIQDVQSVCAIVEKLKKLGVKLSIDDFGTGYSSLSYLKRLKVDKLKIDQSFVHHLGTDPEDAVIVQTIIQMAKNLNLRTIAEGVEDEQALRFLRAHGCDEVQGFHIGRPMTAEKLAGFLDHMPRL